MRIGKYRTNKRSPHGSHHRNLTSRVALFRTRRLVCIDDVVQLEAHEHPLIVRPPTPLRQMTEWGLSCQPHRHIGDFAPTLLGANKYTHRAIAQPAYALHHG
jgi:hypothetical protein